MQQAVNQLIYNLIGKCKYTCTIYYTYLYKYIFYYVYKYKLYGCII